MSNNYYATYPGTNIIRNPGKFEGEPSWLPELWDMVLDGGSDETVYDGDTVDVFILDSALRELIGDDVAETDVAVLVWESEQGSVTQRLMTQDQLDDFRVECKSRINAEEEED